MDWLRGLQEGAPANRRGRRHARDSRSHQRGGGGVRQQVEHPAMFQVDQDEPVGASPAGGPLIYAEHARDVAR